MKSSIPLLCIGLLFTACAQQTKNKTEMEFTDNVKEVLADSGRIDLSSLQWTREPGGFEVKGDTILITTAPHTDLWQRTYYHFQNDNAPVLQICASATCMPVPTKSVLVSMPVHLRNHPSRQYSLT